MPHYIHRALANALQIPPAHVRVIACPNGGGFGGKCALHNHEIVVSKAAILLGRPVKICLTREEVFYMHRGRHPVLMKMRTGVTKDGKITGMHTQTLLDGGAYGGYGAASTFYTGVLQTITYEIPRYKFDACRVFTNKPPCGPKRGHGTPQPRFGQEVQLDKIAERLNIDPAELRLKNILKANAVTANWLKIGSIGLAECIKQVVARSDWKNKFGKLPNGRGVGIACGSYLCGAGLPIYWNKMPQCGVQLLLDRSGQVTVFCGATEIGQGSDDVLAAIVAEVLGIDPFEIRCVTGDTGITPVDLGSYSSRVTVMMGNAAIDAANKLKKLIAEAASEQLEVAPDRLVFSDGRVFFGNKSLTFMEAVGLAEEKSGTLGSVGSYKPPRGPGRYKGAGVGQDDQPGTGARPGGRQRVHGAVRGPDGGADLPPAAAQALQRAGAQDPFAPRVQEPHLARHARGRHGSHRGPGPELPVRREGGRAGAAAPGDACGRECDLRRGRRAHR